MAWVENNGPAGCGPGRSEDHQVTLRGGVSVEGSLGGVAGPKLVAREGAINNFSQKLSLQFSPLINDY